MSSNSTIPLQVFSPDFMTPGQGQAQKLSLQQMAGANTIQKQVQQENSLKLQEDALKLQAQQEDQNDQETLQGAFGDPANFDASGHVDYDKVRASVAPKLRIRNLQNLDKEHISLLQGTAAMDASKRSKLLAQNQSISNELLGVLQAPADQKQASWAGSRQRLIQLGDLDPNDPEYSEAVPDDATLKSLLGKHGYAAQVQKLATDQAAEELKKEQAEKAKQQAARDEAKSIADEIQRKIAEATTDHLKVTNQDEHNQWLKDHPEVAGRMPKKFDPATTPDIIQNMALSADQRSKAGITEEERANRRAQNQETIRHNMAMEAIDRAKAAKERGETANASATDRRLWQRELSTLKGEEDKTTAIRANLENAINSGGKTYVDESGKTKLMSAAAKEENDSANNLTQRMRTQYELLTNRLKRVTEDKNNLGEQLGMQPKWPTKKVHAALDADLQRVLPDKYKPQTAPVATPAPVQPAAPKSSTGQTPVTTTKPVAAAPPKQQASPVSLKLPDGKYITFPNQESVDAAAKKYGLTIQKAQ